MYWKDTWLWAAALILCLTLYHFGRQRKLRDENIQFPFSGWHAFPVGLRWAWGRPRRCSGERRRRGSSWRRNVAVDMQALPFWVSAALHLHAHDYDAGAQAAVALVGLLPTLFNAALIVLNVRV